MAASQATPWSSIAGRSIATVGAVDRMDSVVVADTRIAPVGAGASAFNRACHDPGVLRLHPHPSLWSPPDLRQGSDGPAQKGMLGKLNNYLELLASVVGIATGIAALAVHVDKVGSKSQQRKDIEFWGTLVQSSKSESDKITFAALHRRALSSHVAKSWVTLRSRPRMIFNFNILVVSIYSYAWLGYQVTTNRNLSQLIHEAGLLEFLIPFMMLFLLPEFYASLLAFRIMRTRARKNFLLGEDINIFTAFGDDMRTLRLVGKKDPIHFSLILCSVTTCGLSYVVSSIISFRLTGAANEEFIVTLFVFPISMLSGIWGSRRVGNYLALHSPKIHIEDFYPPHGDKERRKILDLKLKRELFESSDALKDPTFGFRTFFRRF